MAIRRIVQVVAVVLAIVGVLLAAQGALFVIQEMPAGPAAACLEADRPAAVLPTENPLIEAGLTPWPLGLRCEYRSSTEVSIVTNPEGWTESAMVYGGSGFSAAALIVLATTRRRVLS